MKTLFFEIFAFFMTNSIFAQTTAKPNNTVANINANNNNNSSSNNPSASTQNSVAPYLKAKKDNITFGGILNLQLMNQPLGIKFEEIKIRYFISEKIA
jgi:hypothetical protein